MRTKKGIVTSAKMQGTVTVTVHGFRMHPVYRKQYRQSQKFLADTNGQDVAEGDTVIITECRPLSKRKHFRVTAIVTKAAQVSELQEEQELTDIIKPKTPVPEPSPAAS